MSDEEDKPLHKSHKTRKGLSSILANAQFQFFIVLSHAGFMNIAIFIVISMINSFRSESTAIGRGFSLTSLIVSLVLCLFIYALIYFTYLTSERIEKEEGKEVTVFPLWVFFALGIVNSGIGMLNIWAIVLVST